MAAAGNGLLVVRMMMIMMIEGIGVRLADMTGGGVLGHRLGRARGHSGLGCCVQILTHLEVFRVESLTQREIEITL